MEFAFKALSSILFFLGCLSIIGGAHNDAICAILSAIYLRMSAKDD